MGTGAMSEPSRVRASVSWFRRLGPGLITGAADDDPGGIATHSQVGAQFGVNMLWTVLLTYPLVTAIQSVCARIGRVTGKGLAANMTRVFPRHLVSMIVILLFVANTVNIGADLAAMGAAAQLVLGWGEIFFAILFAVGSLVVQVFLPYHRYVHVLKWLTLTLLAYVGVVFTVTIDWGSVVRGLLWPQITWSRDVVTVLVAVFGTTISPTTRTIAKSARRSTRGALSSRRSSRRNPCANLRRTPTYPARSQSPLARKVTLFDVRIDR